MSRLDQLTEADVRKLINSKTRTKASGYLNRIASAKRQGDRLTAKIGKSRIYDVSADLSSGSLHGNCSCPYDWGGDCKHIAALVIGWVRNPTQFENITGIGESKLKTTYVSPRKSFTPKEAPLWVQANFDQRQQQRQNQFQQSLSQYTVNDLRSIAKRRGERVKGARKDDVVERMIERLTDSAETLNTFHSLDEADKALLYMRIVCRPSRIWDVERLVRIAQHWNPKQNKKASHQTLLKPLYDTGLALNREGSYHLTSSQFGHVPSIIAKDLIRHLPPLVATHETPVADELQLADPLAFVRSANQIALLIEQTNPALTPPQPRPSLERYNKSLTLWRYDADQLATLDQSGRLNKNNDEQLTVPPPDHNIQDQTLEGLAGSPAQLEWIYQLLMAVGVLRGGSPVRSWNVHKMAFFQLSEREQQAALARAYFYLDGTWHELWDVLHTNPTLRLQRLANTHYKPPAVKRELIQLRLLVLRVLASVPDSSWISLTALTALMRRLLPTFDSALFDASSYRYGKYVPYWTLTHQGKPADKWGVAQKRFVQQILQVLHWLGLADLGIRNGEIEAFRLQGLADLYWDRAATTTTASLNDVVAGVNSAEAITLINNTIRVNPSQVSPQAHAYFDQIAKLNEAKPTEFIYQLNPLATRQTFEAGVALTELQDQWQTLFNTPIPDEVNHKLSAWWDSYGQVRLYEKVTLIELADEYALAEMKAVTSLEQHIIAEISPQLILIHKSAVDQLATELQQAGYTPKLTDQPD